MVMNADTPLWKAHDISQQLQDKIEVLPSVERAFVHVDHETSHVPVSCSQAPNCLKHSQHIGFTGTPKMIPIISSLIIFGWSEDSIHFAGHEVPPFLLPTVVKHM